MNSSILILCNNKRGIAEVEEVINNNKHIKLLLYDTKHGPQKVIPKILNVSPKAIIALPMTGSEISHLINIPIVLLDPSGLDFMEAFAVAKEFSGREINYVGYSHPTLLEDLSGFERILNIKINTYTYKNKVQKEEAIKLALSDRVKHAVVTSDITRNDIENIGGNAILVKRGRHAILQALRTAVQVIQSKEEETQKNEWLESLLDNVNDGVIGINGGGLITVFNKRAGINLGVLPEKILGRNINSFNKGHPLNILMKREPDQSTGTRSRLTTVKDKVFFVNETKINKNQTIITFKDESDINKLQAALHQESVKRGMVAHYKFEDIIASNNKSLAVIKTAKKYAQSDATILIIGETGVGKEVFAQSIHNDSRRSKGPFVAINCATIPESILESELFGYEGGSFTGAKREGKRGLFELANGGTIFLDEIGEMPVSLQARLLRVLQNKEIMHLGGDNIIPIDVRIIAATNRDLSQAIKEKTFRQDLYYRVAALSLVIPPLRERREDIVKLTEHFLKQKELKYNKNIGKLDKKLMDRMVEYSWPGNVRELENFIEKFVFLYEENDADISTQIIAELNNDNMKSKECYSRESHKELTIAIGSMEEMEREIILKLLENSKVSDLSRILRISRSTIWRKINKK